jgi:hypothetical protein
MAWQTEGTRSVEAWDKASVLIAQEIQMWSEDILEKPSPLFGGLPPCPYARMAWMKNCVMIHVTPEIETVAEIKAFHPPTDELLHIVAWTNFDEMTADEFDEWIGQQNRNHFGVWIMGFHPDSPEDPLTPEFSGNGADDYALLLVQSYSHLIEASENLRDTAYYDKFPHEDMVYINKRKEIFDAWNEKVDAKAQQGREEAALQRRIEGEEAEH